MVNLPVVTGAGRECVRSAVRTLMENHPALFACAGCEWDVVNGWVCAGGDAFDEAVTNRARTFGFEIGL